MRCMGRLSYRLYAGRALPLALGRGGPSAWPAAFIRRHERQASIRSNPDQDGRGHPGPVRAAAARYAARSGKGRLTHSL